MSERTDATTTGQGSGSGGHGPTGQSPNASAQTDSRGQGSQTDSQRESSNGQGPAFDLANHPTFKALALKLDSALQDNKKYRDRLRSVTSEDDDGPDTKATDKGSKLLQETLSELRSERALNRLSLVAAKAGFRTPDLVLNFVSLSEVADEKGNVADPEAVVQSLKEKYPDMFRAIQEGTGDGGAGGRSRNSNVTNDMNAMIRRRAHGNL